MSILKIRDKNGQIIEIPVLKGVPVAVGVDLIITVDDLIQ